VVLKLKVLILFFALLAAAATVIKPPLPRRLPSPNPKDWPKATVDLFATNPLTEEGFQLGRHLFYDVRLSRDNTIACASCHQQYSAFANADHDFSHGYNNSYTNRNAAAVFNVAWMKLLHWDGSINHVEVQPLAPITAPNEMAADIPTVLKKLNADTLYKRLTRAAFGTSILTSQRMLKALAQFTGSIISNGSKYDWVMQKKANFTASEEAGYKVFKIHCNACHTEPLFTSNQFANNGLPVQPLLADEGRKGITGLAADSLLFKIPTLRNITLTGPYMHDGRFFTLSQVIDHYRQKLDTNAATLHPLLKNRLAITAQQRVDLLSFLYSLTDEELIKNKRFAAPPQSAVIQPLHNH
jgi:cytochrome c peroxidase